MKNIYLKISIISLLFSFSFVNAQSVPLNRYYSFSTYKHIYTTNEAPPNSRFEGVLCYLGGTGTSTSVTIFLLIKPSNGDRLMTTSVEEKNNALSIYGYIDGGIVGNTHNAPAVIQTVYRYNNPSAGDHFYTNNYNELGSGKYGYVYEQTLNW